MRVMEEPKDLELEADAHGAMGSGPQAVRKAISITLKKPKFKVKSSTKSSKSKKDKSRDTVDDSDHKSSKRGRTSTYDKKKESESDDREDEELDWSHKVLFVGEKVQNPMIHICEKCSLPILVYGRVSPCKHVFCLSCAEKSNNQCPRCEDRIDRIEPAGIGHIFVCTFGGSRNGASGCRRSYLSQRDLIAHIKHRHEKDGTAGADVDILKQQPNSRMAYFTQPQPLVMQSQINIQPAAPAAQVSNPVIIASLQPGARQTLITNRMPMQTAPYPAAQQGVQYQTIPAQGIQMARPPLQGATYLATSQTTQFPAMAITNTSLANQQSRAPASTAQYMRNTLSGNVQGPVMNPGGTLQPGIQQIQRQRTGEMNWTSAAAPISTGQDWTSIQGRTSSYQSTGYYK